MICLGKAGTAVGDAKSSGARVAEGMGVSVGGTGVGVFVGVLDGVRVGSGLLVAIGRESAGGAGEGVRSASATPNVMSVGVSALAVRVARTLAPVGRSVVQPASVSRPINAIEAMRYIRYFIGNRLYHRPSLQYYA
jgi:hypothetical protein